MYFELLLHEFTNKKKLEIVNFISHWLQKEYNLILTWQKSSVQT